MRSVYCEIRKHAQEYHVRSISQGISTLLMISEGIEKMISEGDYHILNSLSQNINTNGLKELFQVQFYIYMY